MMLECDSYLVVLSRFLSYLLKMQLTCWDDDFFWIFLSKFYLVEFYTDFYCPTFLLYCLAYHFLLTFFILFWLV